MNSHFDALKNRQKREETNKSSLRNKIRTKKNSVVNDANYDAKDEFDLPQVFKEKLEELKIQIRNKIQREKQFRVLITLFISILMFAIFMLLFTYLF